MNTLNDVNLAAIDPGKYPNYRREVIFNCHKWDPQVGDVNTISDHVAVLDPLQAQKLCENVETLAAETNAMEAALARHPELYQELGLGKKVREGLRRADNQLPQNTIRVMRFDFHPTTDGWAISEVNSDVPGGFSEASAVPQVACQYLPGVRPHLHTGELLAKAFVQRLGTGAVIGFVHATSYSDDRQVMHFLAECVSSQGCACRMLAPDHIRWQGDRAVSIAESQEGPIDGMVRFFPVEWLPLLSKKATWQGYFSHSVPACNHATAILTQSKRLPLVWDRLGVDASAWKRLLPLSADPRNAPWATDPRWIVKPALGRVGEQITIREVTPDKEWKQISRSAKQNPRDWLAQQRFDSRPLPTRHGDRHLCVGVFTVDGKAAGFYGRVSKTPRIDQYSQDIAVVVRQSS